MDLRFQSIFFQNEFVAEYMIDVAMCIQQEHRLQVMGADKTCKLTALRFIITARIDNDALPALIRKHIGVFLERTERKMLNIYHFLVLKQQFLRYEYSHAR